MNKKNEDEQWTGECEELLAEWSEKASCYRWLHGRSEKKYKKQYYSFSIPVIILSTLTGAANVGMDSFVPPESKPMASAIVGGVNIIAGIISTLQNFLKVAELMEAHRIAGVSWGKLGRNISIELALDPSRRVIQSDFLKLSRAEYDRLIEAGPIIDDDIIKQFNKKFKNYEVSIPSICNGLDKCTIYKIDNSNVKENYNDGIEDLLLKNKEDTIDKNMTIKVLDSKVVNDNESVENVNKENVVKNTNDNESVENVNKENVVKNTNDKIVQTNDENIQTNDDNNDSENSEDEENNEMSAFLSEIK